MASKKKITKKSAKKKVTAPEPDFGYVKIKGVLVKKNYHIMVLEPIDISSEIKYKDPTDVKDIKQKCYILPLKSLFKEHDEYYTYDLAYWNPDNMKWWKV